MSWERILKVVGICSALPQKRQMQRDDRGRRVPRNEKPPTANNYSAHNKMPNPCIQICVATVDPFLRADFFTNIAFPLLPFQEMCHGVSDSRASADHMALEAKKRRSVIMNNDIQLVVSVFFKKFTEFRFFQRPTRLSWGALFASFGALRPLNHVVENL